MTKRNILPFRDNHFIISSYSTQLSSRVVLKMSKLLLPDNHSFLPITVLKSRICLQAKSWYLNKSEHLLILQINLDYVARRRDVEMSDTQIWPFWSLLTQPSITEMSCCQIDATIPVIQRKACLRARVPAVSPNEANWCFPSQKMKGKRDEERSSTFKVIKWRLNASSFFWLRHTHISDILQHRRHILWLRKSFYESEVISSFFLLLRRQVTQIRKPIRNLGFSKSKLCSTHTAHYYTLFFMSYGHWFLFKLVQCVISNL